MKRRKKKLISRSRKKTKTRQVKKYFEIAFHENFQEFLAKKTRENEMNKFHGNNLKFFNPCGKKCSTKKFLKTDIFLFIGLGLS